MIYVTNKKIDSPRVGHVTIYVGRPSVLGNPLPLQHERDRDYVIDMYSEWLASRMVWDSPQRREVSRIRDLVKAGHHVALECFCHPKRCHADVVKCAVEMLL